MHGKVYSMYALHTLCGSRCSTAFCRERCIKTFNSSFTHVTSYLAVSDTGICAFIVVQ